MGREVRKKYTPSNKKLYKFTRKEETTLPFSSLTLESFGRMNTQNIARQQFRAQLCAMTPCRHVFTFAEIFHRVIEKCTKESRCENTSFQKFHESNWKVINPSCNGSIFALLYYLPLFRSAIAFYIFPISRERIEILCDVEYCFSSKSEFYAFTSTPQKSTKQQGIYEMTVAIWDDCEV